MRKVVLEQLKSFQFNIPGNVTLFDAALNVALLVRGSRKGKAKTLH